MTVPAPRVGPFEVGRELGRRGVRVVHAAVPRGGEPDGRTAPRGDTAARLGGAAPSRGPEVALKVLPPDLAADRELRARFAREARTLAALASPHVLPVRGYGEADGRLYLASDLVPDGDLERMLQLHGAPPLDLALRLVLQAAQGLADAHDAGLVHGGIKPANVMLRRRDGGFDACLTDFGVASAAVPGDARWAAPELHDGSAPTPASDVYSLGCVLWAALTGQAPYDGTTDFQLASAHLTQPPRQLAGGSPLVLQVNAVLRRALAKDPRRRHSSAHQLRDALRHALTLAGPRDRRAVAVPGPAGGSTAAAGRPRPSRTRTALLAAAGVAAAVTVGVVGTLLVVDGGSGAPVAAVGAAVEVPAAGSAEADRAVDGIAEALSTQLLVGPDNAHCIASRWVDEVGLSSLAEAGFLDAEMGFRDRDLERVDPALKESLGAATRACLS